VIHNASQSCSCSLLPDHELLKDPGCKQCPYRQKRSNRERMPNEEGSLELGEVKRLKTVLEQVREAWSEG
jgi:hypothetical protein